MLEKVPKEIPGFPLEAVLVGLLASLMWSLIYRGREPSSPGPQASHMARPDA